MTLATTILESPDKVNEKRFVFERPAQFSKAVQCYATFNV